MFGETGTPEVVELIINVRLGMELLYDTKISIDLQQYVYNLKYKMHEMDNGLVLNLLTAVYCGRIMEDHNLLKMYNLFDGATVHLFKQIKPEKVIVPKTVSETDLVRLLTAIHSIPYNRTFKTALLNLKKTEELDKLTATIPGLNEDPVSITLLRHPELLKQYDRDTIKSLVDSHPTLAIAILKIASNVNEENLREYTDATRPLDDRSDDEDIEGIDELPPLSGFSNQLATRNLPFRAITSAQLASALSSVTEHLQPSTSSATNIRNVRILVPSTSDVNPTATNTGNILVPSTSTGIVSNANTRNISRQLRYISLPSQLQTMRNMGLTNDTLNSEALRRTGDLRLAIDLVLSGFSTPDIV